MAKNSSPRIQESNSRAKTKSRNSKKLKMAKTSEAERTTEDSQYAKVVRELESAKQELSNLKLGMASVLQGKIWAEQETNSSLLNTLFHERSVETLTREIEEINGENVLVELAKIEAIEEYGEIEAQRKEKNEQFLKRMKVTRKKTKKLAREIENAKKLENKLAVTLSDINILKKGLKKIKEMMKRTARNESSKFQSLLDSVKKELEAAKKELDSIKEGGFQFMASMYVVRNELKQAMEGTSRLKEKERKTEMSIQNLHLKLLRAKAKLEATSTTENKAKTTLSNLSLTLELLKSEAVIAKNDLSRDTKETAIIRQEVLKTDNEIDSVEGKLEEESQKLKAVKSSELIALENLRAQIEITKRNRASINPHSSKITISKFEYEYLIGHAAAAKEIADKKVKAAHSWIEAELEIGVSSRAMNQIFETTPARKVKTRRSSYPIGRHTFRVKSFTVRRKKKITPTTAPVLLRKEEQ